MGLLLTQLATARGARVIGTVSTEEKERLARAAGAAEVIRYTEVDDLAAEVREHTDGEGVAAVYDGVGATTFDASLASLREELAWRAGEVLEAVRDGSLRISVSGRYPLAEAGRAHQDLQGRRTTGKLLLTPSVSRNSPQL